MNGQFCLVLHITKNERVYTFSAPLHSPYEDASEVAKEFSQGILELQQQAIKTEEDRKVQAELDNMKSDKESNGG